MRGTLILACAAVLTAVDVLVPYLVLKDIPSFMATYFFWCVLTFAVIAGAIVYMRRWGRR